MDPKEIGCEGVDWFYMAEDGDKCRHLLNTVMNFPFSYNAGNFLTGCGTTSISGTIIFYAFSWSW
jgi:hypothetical protein